MAIGTLQGEEEKHFSCKLTCMYSPQVLNCCLHPDTTVLTTIKWSKYKVVLYNWPILHIQTMKLAGNLACPLLSVGSLAWLVGHIKFLLEVAS